MTYRLSRGNGQQSNEKRMKTKDASFPPPTHWLIHCRANELSQAAGPAFLSSLTAGGEAPGSILSCADATRVSG